MSTEIQTIDFAAANKVLARIRASLSEEEEGGNAAWGPESEQPVVGHLEGEPGEMGADNVTDIGDMLDKYFSVMAENLIAEYELTEEEAYDFLFDVADSLASEGALPEFPGDNASDEEFAVWYGKANSVKFDAMVMAAAKRELE